MRVLSCCVLILVLGAQTFGQGYKEIRKKIVPLYSSKEDVEKIPGLLEQKGQYSTREGKYKTRDEEITVYYAEVPCTYHGWDVKSGTVLSYEITPLNPSKFDPAGLITNQLVEVSDDAAYRYLTDVHSGIRYMIDPAGSLLSVEYFPSKQNGSLRCRGFPEYTPINYPMLDTFGFNNMSRWDVGLLANTLMRVEKIRDSEAYVFVYYPRNQKNKTQWFKKKIENFAFNIFKADPKRVHIILGGLRDEGQIETYVIKFKNPKPMATPKYGR